MAPTLPLGAVNSAAFVWNIRPCLCEAALLSIIVTIIVTPTNDQLHGHLDLLILSSLAGGPMHGWAIAQRLRILSDQVFEVGQGSIYPALRRLEAAGWISAKVAVSEAGRRARFYSLTPAGRRQLATEREEWVDFAAAVQRVLDAV